MVTMKMKRAKSKRPSRFILVGALPFISAALCVMSKSKSFVAEALSTDSKRILCYGDSLTAGTSPPLFDNFPYAPHLERVLKNQYMEKAVVRHRGLPGWTSKQMVVEVNGETAGLRTAIKAVKDPPLALVIILAGTNDLGYEKSATPILDSIISLHLTCYDEGIAKTLAIGIPPSGYQSVSTDAAALAKEVNRGLSEFCEARPDQAVYTPFPFDYVQGGENWSPDGLHFSAKGYEALGESLAPTVAKVLS